MDTSKHQYYVLYKVKETGHIYSREFNILDFTDIIIISPSLDRVDFPIILSQIPLWLGFDIFCGLY